MNKHLLVLVLFCFVVASILLIQKMDVSNMSFYSGFVNASLYVCAVMLGGGVIYLSKMLLQQVK